VWMKLFFSRAHPKRMTDEIIRQKQAIREASIGA